MVLHQDGRNSNPPLYGMKMGWLPLPLLLLLPHASAYAPSIRARRHDQSRSVTRARTSSAAARVVGLRASLNKSGPGSTGQQRLYDTALREADDAKHSMDRSMCIAHSCTSPLSDLHPVVDVALDDAMDWIDGVMNNSTYSEAVSSEQPSESSTNGSTDGSTALLSRENLARGVLACVAAAYGTNYAFVKLLGGWIDTPAEASLMRFAISLATMLPLITTLAAKQPRLVEWPLARDGMLVGTCFAMGYATQALALQTSEAGIQAFLLSLTVVVCPILESVLDRRQQPQKVWVAAALALVGVGCLESGSLISGNFHPGDLLGLLQAVFFGTGFYICERAMHRHSAVSADSGLPVAIAITTWEMVAISIISIGWVGMTGGSDAFARLGGTASMLVSDPLAHMPVIGALVWTGVVTTAACCVLEAAVLGEISSADATVIFATEPLWAVLWSFVLLGETLAPSCLLGGALMVSACLVSGSEESTANQLEDGHGSDALLAKQNGANEQAAVGAQQHSTDNDSRR